MRYVVTQYERWPETVVGTVSANSREQAVAYARAMWGLAGAVEWSRASRRARREALRQDQRANVWAQARLLGLAD